MPSSRLRVAVGLVCGAGALALCLVAGFRVVSAAEVTLATREVSLGEVHPGALDSSPAVSPDSKRLAYAAQRGGMQLVVVDGVEGKEYDGIGVGTLLFSADSKRVAYVAGRGGKLLVVVDGVEGKEFDGIGKGTLVFSPDSQRVAYVASRGGMQLVVADGVEGKEYDGAANPVFSPDSKRVAYGAQRGGKRLVVVDGVEGKECDGFLSGSRLVFDSPSQLHTLAVRGGEFLRVEVEIVMPAAKPSGAPRPHL